VTDWNPNGLRIKERPKGRWIEEVIEVFKENKTEIL
jgi:hypothetical protein